MPRKFSIMQIFHWFLVISVGITPLAHSQTQTTTDEGLVVRWDFGAEETTPLMSHGGVHRDIRGLGLRTIPISNCRIRPSSSTVTVLSFL